MNKTIKLTVVSLGCVLALSACSKAKEELGLTRQSPDEFAVVKRAPLEMPPDYALRPPQPGAPRPQETATDEQAREVVFGGTQKTAPQATAKGEDLLLQKAGADIADPNIRTIVNRETAALEPKDKPVAKRLFGWTLGNQDEAPPAEVVDAPAEAERLKTNAEKGKPVTEGATPTVEE
ncbi:MAG: DUF3035 domain-containing protein [Rhodospirillales bacterium]|nr:DUF3035 domain-containing protein [Rhodospirillales bacterium]